LPDDTDDADARWVAPPGELALEAGEVHVWRASLCQGQPAAQALSRTLARDERERAERFHLARDGERFVAARGLLRAILGRYLAIEPGAVSLGYSRHGKPELAGDHSAARIQFNLSHSGDLALFAFTRGMPVGIDVEHQRDEAADLAIAEQCFSPRELAALRALPAAQRSAAFFNCWTRKEAYVKARGEGLSLPLSQFDVSLAPGAPAELLHVVGDPHERARWSLRALEPGPGYVAALAVEGHGWALRRWEWPRSTAS
jgi:4'-phosphopantetheinyl transferase